MTTGSAHQTNKNFLSVNPPQATATATVNKRSSADLTIFGTEAKQLATVLNERRAEPAPGQHHHKKKNAFSGVFIPTCENMWGVLIFLRFYSAVGYSGVGFCILAIVMSFLVAFCTTSCLSAIASSGGLVSQGGPYYMISRSLGPYVGATVGLTKWLAITMLAVLESVGLVDALLLAAPGLNAITQFKRVVSTGALALIGLTVWGGINFVSKLGVFFMVVVVLTIVFYYVGLIICPWSAKAHELQLSGLSSYNLSNNLGPDYGEGRNFGWTLSIMFPCFTGILSGANRADILKDPSENIKNGTFGAVCFSLVIYVSYVLLWGAVADRAFLKDEPTSTTGSSSSHRRLSGGGGSGNVVDALGWPSPLVVYIGIIISSLSQALQCLIVAPKMLQSIAADDFLPFLRPLAPLSKSKEPVRALAVTLGVGLVVIQLQDLDTVAPLLTMCFLVCYAFMNISCLILTILRSPTWRPKGIFKKRWRTFHILISSLGFVMCLVVMVVVSVYWALGVVALALGLYLLLSWKGEEAEWGSGLDGVRYNLAMSSLIGKYQVQYDCKFP